MTSKWNLVRYMTKQLRAIHTPHALTVGRIFMIRMELRVLSVSFVVLKE
jgi:hypothetical protein